MNVNLSQRSKQILEAIVEDYIATAEPVGSSAVAKRHAMALSSATVRNVMASLEELGLLASPHTSAGRIPTDKGFRFYVDSLVSLRQISHKEKRQILRHYRETGGNLADLLQEASRALSLLSNYTGIVMAPSFTQGNFRHIEFIRLSANRLLVILVAGNGNVQNRIVETEQDFTAEDLVRMGNYLNSILEGLTIRQVRDKILAEMADDKTRYDQFLANALELSCQVIPDEQNELYIAGQSRIFEQPEFADVSKMREILAAFEEKGQLVRLLENCMNANGVQIFIGSETPLKEMSGMSLITSTYMTDSNTIGLLGVVGPTRMGYSSVIPIVDYTARLVSKLLTKE
ncbi:MAG: heat-inducible transcriptional repressor HrcA [Trichlorobacter sp.]|nr:heat-inducible transcriptional repressor HrcA [Trichlorobacter sp.]